VTMGAMCKPKDGSDAVPDPVVAREQVKADMARNDDQVAGTAPQAESEAKHSKSSSGMKLITKEDMKNMNFDPPPAAGDEP